MPFIDMFFCSAERNHLCNFERGYYEEQFCEIIMNLDQSFRRRFLLKDISYLKLGGPFVQQSEPFVQFWKRAL